MPESAKKTILLVEDEVLISMSEKVSLETYGYAVQTVNAGEQAVEAVKASSKIDLILMDINLGQGIDGTQTAELILKDFDIPIVFLSSHSERDIVEKTEKITSYGYVVKSSSITVLDASIKMAFKLFEANRKIIESEASIRKKLDAILEPEGDIGALSLADIIDHEAFRDLIEEFYRITDIGIGILDIQGNVLVGFGWQDICTKFHRLNPDTLRNCIESDVILSDGVQAGKFKTYKCKNNLWEVMTPIVINGEHLGNICLGQFFYEGEVLDYDLFRDQARRYGFDETEYIDALNQVRRWSRNTVDATMKFYAKLAGLISSLSYSTIKLSRTLSRNGITLLKLRESEAKFRRMFDQSPIGAAMVSLDHYFLVANETLCELTGYSSSELSSRKTSDITHPDDLAMNTELSRRLQAGEIEHYEMDKRYIHRNGSILWIHLNVRMMLDEDGEPNYFLPTMENITERKRVEEALQVSKDTADMLLNVAAELIVSLDSHGNITLLNESGHKLLGYESPELFGKNWFDTCLPEGNRLDVSRYYGQLLHGDAGNVSTHENDIITKTGERKTIFWHNALLKNTEGDFAGVFSSGEDLTERKKVEESLRESESRFKTMFNEAPLGIIKTDSLTGRIDLVNPAFAKITGRSIEELVDMDWMSITHPEDIQKDFDRMALLNAGEINGFQMEKRYMHKDGSIVWINMTIAALSAENTKAPCHLCMVEDITERKQTEAALQKNGELHRTILQTALDGYWLTDAQGRIIEVNESYCKMSGYRRQELLTMSIPDIAIPENDTEIPERMKRILLQGAERFDSRHRCKDGSVLEVEVSVQRLPTEGNHLVSFFRDITGRKKAEEALRESEKRFKTMLNKAPLGIALIDSYTGQIIEVNSMFAEIAGRTEEEMASIDWMSITHPDDIQEDLDNMALLNAGKINGFQMKKRYLKPDGTVVWISMTIAPIYENDKTHHLHLSMIEDITERKFAEDKIKQISERVLLATTSGEVGIWDLDVVNNILAWDDQMFRLYGITPQNFGGTYETWKSGVHPEDIERSDAEVQMALRGEKELDTEFRVVWPDGTIHCIAARARVHRDSVGQPLKLVGTNMDITERKKTEDRMKVLLAEKELILKEVHHRVKNNLNTISSLLSLQAQTLSEPSAQYALKDTGSRVKSLMMLHDKLYQSADYAHVSLKDYLSDLVDEIIRNFPNAQNVKVEKKIVDFVLDAKRLQPLGIIINELLSNIMKYAFVGRTEGLIRVSITNTEGHVGITIQDDGNGIPDSVSFENSTGLGLQLVSALTAQLNGSIRIERGKGTKVVLEFEI